MTLDLMKEFEQSFLVPLSEVKPDVSPVRSDLDTIAREQIEVIQGFLENPGEHGQLKDDAARRVAQSVKQLGLPSPQLHSFIAPMGDGAYEILRDIREGLGLDV